MKIHKKIKPGNAIAYVILTFWALTTIFPFAWVLLNSFKSSAEVLNASFALPKEFNLDNYHTAFSRMNILTAYKNSCELAVAGTRLPYGLYPNLVELYRVLLRDPAHRIE